MALPVSNLVQVTINLSPLAAAGRSFGVLLIAGDSNVISGAERLRTYENIDGVAADFGTTAPEYLAAVLYFGQTPSPAVLMIGRWISSASSGMNEGAILTAQQQLLANFTTISSGGMTISIDGSSQALSGLNFTSQTNLNGVASIITEALSGAVCTWNGENFVITSNSTGAGAAATGTVTLTGNPSYGVQAHGTITLTGQPSNGDTVDIKGTTVTFVTGTPSGNQVQISAVDDTHTSANLQAFLQASADSNLSACTYNTIGLVTTVTAIVYGTAGNSYVLSKSGTNITVSGSGDLAGGVAPDTLTIGGTAITFVANAPTGNQVLVGPNLLSTSANLQTFLAASSDSNIDQCTYISTSGVTTVTFKVSGTSGNSFTLAKSSSSISLSASTLAGGVVPSSVGYATSGAGTDVSSLFGFTAALSQGLVGGYNAETPVACIAVLANQSPAWYGSMFASTASITNTQHLAVAAFIEAQQLTRMYGVTITTTDVLSPLITTDLASEMMAAGYEQSTTQYSSSSAYAIASLFGRAFSVDFTANNSTITLMYKQEPGVTGEDLTVDQAQILQQKRCNVFVDYVNGTMIIQYGTMAGPAWFDEIHGLDWFQDAVQTACYNVLYTSPTKIPQTDAGVNQLANAISGVCQQAVANGLAAPGTWTAQGFGQLQTGTYLKTGYYIYATPVALQSQSDREARVAPPIQVALKLAGAIQSLNVLVNVNR